MLKYWQRRIETMPLLPPQPATPATPAEPDGLTLCDAQILV
jgi:hypothetical protein